MRTRTHLMGRGRVLLRAALPLDPEAYLRLLQGRFGARLQVALGPKVCCGSIPHRFRLSADRRGVLVTLLKGSSARTREMDVLALQDAMEDLLPKIRAA